MASTSQGPPSSSFAVAQGVGEGLSDDFYERMVESVNYSEWIPQKLRQGSYLYGKERAWLGIKLGKV